jgi:hypothetical protein
MKAIVAILITVGKNLLAMLLTERMVFWALELAAKKTKNKVDEQVVKLVKAAYRSDEQRLREAVESLAEQTNAKINRE